MTKFKMGALLCAGIVAGTFSGAAAQDFPTRPITIVHPYASGSATDVSLRLIVESVSTILGQRVIVENRPGGGGAVGAAVTKLAQPDGYTLMQADQGMFAAAPHLTRNLSYNPLKDFQPITHLWDTYSVLIVGGSSTAKTVGELAALGKARQGGLNNATQGVGSSGHMIGLLTAKAFGSPMTHVPYGGGAAAKPDVLSGRVDMTFVIYGLYKTEIEQGKARVLAVAADQRVPLWPTVPTMKEAGYPGIDYVQWFGLVGPTGMNPAIVQKLNAAFAAALVQPAVAGRLAETNGFVVRSSTPEALAQTIRSSYAALETLVKDSGLEQQ